MKDGQEHYADEAWVNFIRARLSPEETRQMQEHVNRRCAECLRSFALWRDVLDLEGTIAKYRASEYAVNFVKLAFTLKQRVPFLHKFAQAARLVFDSLHEPLPEGIRTGGTAPRQFLYSAGRYLIDLRLETEGELQACVAGQVTRADGAQGATAGTGIVLVHGTGTLVVMTIANTLGEFYLEFKQQPGLTLFLDVPGGGTLRVPLPGL